MLVVQVSNMAWGQAALPLLTVRAGAQAPVPGWHSPAAATVACGDRQQPSTSVLMKFLAPSAQEIWTLHEWWLKLDLRKVHL